MKQRRAADRVKKSKGGFSVLLDRGRKEPEEEEVGYNLQCGEGDLCDHKTGLFPLIWSSSCTPASPACPAHTLNYSDIYADTKTQRFFTAAISIPCPAILLSPFPFALPHRPCFTIAGTEGVCGGRLSTLLTSTASLTSPSASFHLFPSVRLYLVFLPLRRVVKYIIDFLQLRLSDCRVCRPGSLSGFSYLPIKLSGDPLKPHRED